MSKEELEEKKKRKKKRKVKKKKGKKDACYHKVRSRYDVWPSAYASGALVKCRKVGAANWGNKSKKKSKKNESKEKTMKVLKNENLEASPELEFYKNYAANYKRKGQKAPLDLSKHVPQQDGKGGYILPRFARTGNFIKIAEKELGKSYEEIKNAILAGLGYSKMNEEFKPHMMYDPKTGKSEKTKVKADHHRLAKKGYTHVNPKDIEKVLKDEGGASGMDPFLKAIGKDMEEEIIKTLEAMPNVGQHKDKDYILHDDKEIHVQKEGMSLNKKIRIRIVKSMREST